MGDRPHVAIVGAGPYGLSLATHLKAEGVPFRIFGRPMQFWCDLPAGMFLKSLAFATNVYTPDGRLGFVDYSRERGLETVEPCAMADFARYGVWAQRWLVPEVEEVDVVHLSRSGATFELVLSDDTDEIRCTATIQILLKKKDIASMTWPK